MKQKDIFLESEGDQWFARNRQAVSDKKLPDDDFILREIIEIYGYTGSPKILEIRCGDGTRLDWLKTHLNADVYGVEPSAKACIEACAKGLQIQQGTAEALPFDDASFDIVIFGFCLYLVDRQDLFKIASEANRVLRTPGWLMILDFYSPSSQARAYHHLPGLTSYKMDYRNMFNWHPDYECMTHYVRHHNKSSYTDDSDEWMAVSIMRKQEKG
jgi:ubiquinone/menaquinone biosynthesis C-methylase UbiE